MQYASSQSSNPMFTYTDTNPQMMEMALRFLSQQQTGDSGRWIQYTNEVANQFMQTSISPAGIQGQGYGNMMTELPQVEDAVLRVFDLVDMGEIPRQPCYDLRSESGVTMLILAAALGMHRVAAALLARGANPDVRDKAGYTALMHAAIHGRSKTFQLLLVRGADPTLRSLKGYAAVDLLRIDERDIFLEILQNTQRSRSTRPSFHLRHSYGSFASSKNSWDMSSASFYESDVETSEHAVSMPPSRRPSANVSLPALLEDMAGTSPMSASPALIAWRDALSTQIHYFHQSVHSSMSNFQLPALPPLPDYQDNAMVRRLSSLVPSRYSTRAATPVNAESGQSPTQQPRFWDLFSSAPPSSSVPPPAYSELFPDKAQLASDRASEKSAVQHAVVEAVADEKCVIICDEASGVEPEAAACSQSGDIPKKPERRTIPSWLWVSL